MKTNKHYHNRPETNPMRLENIEEKRIIHQFENKSIHIQLDKLEDKKKANELR